MYSVNNCGMNFEWSLFEFTTKDSQLLAKGLKATPTLQIFRLNRSKVDDQKGRLIISHLLDHPSLTVLGEYHYDTCHYKSSFRDHSIDGTAFLARLLYIKYAA